MAREFSASAPTKQETLREQTLKEITNRATKYNEKVALKAGSGVGPWGTLGAALCQMPTHFVEKQMIRHWTLRYPGYPIFRLRVQEDSWNHGSLLGRHSE